MLVRAWELAVDLAAPDSPPTHADVELALDMLSGGMKQGASPCTPQPVSASSSTGVEAADDAQQPTAVQHVGALRSAQQARGYLTSSRCCEWYSPQPIVQFVHDLFSPGGIDLDPCSSPAANLIVKARTIYTAEVDGLDEANKWSGSVFLNAPYGMRGADSMQGTFVRRCIREFRSGNVTRAVMLVKAAVGYAWFDALYDFPMCWLSARLAYVHVPEAPTACDANAPGWGKRCAPHGSVLVFLGPPHESERFAQLAQSLGRVPTVNAWPRHTAYTEHVAMMNDP
jgi:hypothetical protein